jgi:2-deoxy-D-gluconate 3-dehydrogenase
MASQLFSLAGRVALITGGNSGIGKALAMAYRDAGARVVIASRRADRNAAAVDEIGGDTVAVTLDVADEASVARAVAEVADRCGRLDILVNNAGTVNRRSVLELELADWNRVLDTNLTGAFLCTKHAGRLMQAQGAGKIINIASVNGVTAPSKGLQVAYAVSKSGVIALTRVNAVELAPLGIQVNAIAPGYFITEMTADLAGKPIEDAIRRRTPNGRLGDLSELVGTGLYLASSASNHVTGVCIPVDGGYLASDGLER